MRAWCIALAIAGAGCSGAVGTIGVERAALTSMGSFGGLNMYGYVPAGVPPSAPLVVALHGCGQTAAEYVNAGWNELADVAHFYVVYAEVPSGGCFSWTSSSDITRGSGQALAIKQMVDAMKAKYSIDASRVFVTGLSAGGAMTAVMLATYPDVFAAGAPMAGIAYRSGLGGSADAMTLGNYVRDAFSGFKGPYPRVSVWQGQNDTVVSPSNATTIVSQWTNVHAQGGMPTATGSVSGAMHSSYAVGGQTVVESYLVPNMGHGTALKVGFTPAGGCGQAGSFLLDAGICSTYYAGLFFGLLQSAPVYDGGGGAIVDLGPGAPGGNGSDGGGGGGGGGAGNGGSGGGGPGGSGGSDAGGPPMRAQAGCSLGGDSDAASPALFVVCLLAFTRYVSCLRRRRR